MEVGGAEVVEGVVVEVEEAELRKFWEFIHCDSLVHLLTLLTIHATLYCILGM